MSVASSGCKYPILATSTSVNNCYLPYLETLVEDSHCFKTRVLHLKVKNTPLKAEKWKLKVQKSVQFSFCRGRGAFSQEIVLRGIQPCFLHDETHGLF